MFSQHKTLKIQTDHKIAFLIFVITFSIFVFSSHGHRYTSDEYFGFVSGNQIATQTPPPDLIPPEDAYIKSGGTKEITIVHCNNGILCSHMPIGYSISFVPFIIFEKTFHIIPNFHFTDKDFKDPFYLWWRNSLPMEETFTFLFFGPLISSLSTAVLFLIGRTYQFSYKTSLSISLLYSFSTMAWAYSTTGLNIVESTLFILLSFFFFRRFLLTNKTRYLLFVGLSLGFGVNVRDDVVLFGLVLVGFITYHLLKRERKIRNFSSFILPLVFFAAVYQGINIIRFGSGLISHNITFIATGGTHTTPLYIGIYGLLFSPGAGIFIFSPILLFIFISFFDFYKKDRVSLLFITSYFVILLIFYGSLNFWHGFVAWGARYMVPVIPFLLILLGASIERRKSKIFKISLTVLGGLGAFFSFSWLVQDVSWFVWGLMGTDKGLYALGLNRGYPLQLHPVVFWTFQYSQLTQSIITEFSNLQVDLLLFKIMGPTLSFLILCIIIIPSALCIKRLIR